MINVQNIFQRDLYEKTTIDEECFSIYRRWNNGRTIEKNEIILDNQYDMPNILNLFVKYRSHWMKNGLIDFNQLKICWNI